MSYLLNARTGTFIPPFVSYLPILVLFSHQCFIPHMCFIPPSVFYLPIHVLSPHPCFIPSSVFYPLNRVLCESSEVIYIIVALAKITPGYNLITVGIETATYAGY
jgi:hypothetical protein